MLYNGHLRPNCPGTDSVKPSSTGSTAHCGYFVRLSSVFPSGLIAIAKAAVASVVAAPTEYNVERTEDFFYSTGLVGTAYYVPRISLPRSIRTSPPLLNVACPLSRSLDVRRGRCVVHKRSHPYCVESLLFSHIPSFHGTYPIE